MLTIDCKKNTHKKATVTANTYSLNMDTINLCERQLQTNHICKHCIRCLLAKVFAIFSIMLKY